MFKPKFIVPTLLSVAGTSVYVFAKKRKQAKQELVKKRLNDSIKKEFGNQNINGYWIDFDNHKGLEYECGINIKNEETGLKESYTFLFTPETGEIYRIKLINDSYE